MKKIYFVILPLIVLLFGSKSLAYNAPAGGDYKYYYTFTTPETSSTYASTYEIWSDAKFGLVNVSGTYYFSTLLKDTNGKYKVTTFSGNGNYKLPYISANNGYSPDTFGTPDYSTIKQPQARLTIRGNSSPISNGKVLVVNSSQLSYPNNVGIQTYNSFQNEYSALLEDYINNLYDWNDPQYNPNMPIPEFTTNYNEIRVTSSSPQIPFDINFVNPNNDYFIEIYINYWIPDNMSIDIFGRGKGTNDGFVYKALSKELVSNYLIEPTQMLRINGINNLSLQLQTNWQNALMQVPIESIQYVNTNNLPSGMFNQYKVSYEDYCRNILGFYGSQFTIMMRYFTFVNDSQYVVGAWRTWTTYSPNEFTERLPDYYVPYVPASGEENITNNTDPETVQVVSGTGNSTGVVSDPNYYITVNQNIPNYPDYPTVASYNKDNLLLDTINQMNSLNAFFGQFGEFLTMSFSFFPAWIWAIIGVGFSISIVVMFLKIL